MSQTLLFSSPETLIDDEGEAVYHPAFFSPDEADAYFKLCNEVNWRQDKIRIYGQEHNIPRETAWFSIDGISYTYSGIDMYPEPFPDFISEINERIKTKFGYEFNSVLLNKYRNGEDKVSWHADDEPELGESVDIASISLGAERDFMLRKKNKSEVSTKIAMAHGSLLIMKHPLQIFWEHSLPRRKGILEPRINMTFRKILKP